MKKLIAIAILAVSAATASAQMMTSRTLIKRENPTTWYVRLGMPINMLSGLSSEEKDAGYSTGSKVGFEADFGFNKPMGKSGAYWGMEFGLTNRGGKIIYEDSKNGEKHESSLNTWSLKYSPVTFGYKYSVTDNIKIDGHVGAYAMYDMSQKAEDENGNEFDEDQTFENSFDAGVQAGLGVWYNKFNLDFTYQRGFVDFTGKLKSSAVVIRLGYAF